MKSHGNVHFTALATLTLLAALMGTSGCAGRRNTQLVEPQDMRDSGDGIGRENAALRKKIDELQNKIQSLEAKLAALNAKVNGPNAPEAAPEAASATPSPHAALPTAGVTHLPSEGVGESVSAASGSAAATLPGDPEAGFINDAPVQAYRRAMISRLSHDTSAAIVGFSQFVEKYPDHPLAGNAQYYVGEGYLAQKESKLALKEFERVMTTYDRSPLVSMALYRAADLYDSLKQPEQAARTRQLLTSLFPQSPAAGLLRSGSAAPAAAATSATLAEPPTESAAMVEGKLETPPPGGLTDPTAPTETAPTLPLVVNPRATPLPSAGLDAPPTQGNSP